MKPNLWLRCVLCVFFVFGIIACDLAPSTAELATVRFVNLSAFDVRIYRNFTPEQFPAAYVGTSVAGTAPLNLSLPPSDAGGVGCTFFLRYQIALPGSIIPGVNNQGVMVGAAPNWANIPKVLKANETYDLQLNNPTVGDLRFVRGYIAIHNQTLGSRVWLEDSFGPLPRMDNGAYWLNPGDIGFYEIDIPPGQDVMQAILFRIRDEQARLTPIESFELARGYLYRFVFNQDGVGEPTILGILDRIFR